MSSAVWTPGRRDQEDRTSFPGWWSKDYVPLPIIERYADDALRLFAGRCGGGVSFPLDAEQLVQGLFGLDVYYDNGSIMDAIDPQLLGCLYADGMVCPATGTDRVIMVNDAPRFKGVTTAFTILHEAGHWLLHHPKDAVDAGRSAYCRTEDVQPRWSRVPPREWQASRFAGEVLMPRERVRWLLDGREPGDIINLQIYGLTFRQYFGVSQAAMEKRLFDLGYKCAFGRHAYANVTTVT
jgi:hypothetical protein